MGPCSTVAPAREGTPAISRHNSKHPNPFSRVGTRTEDILASPDGTLVLLTVEKTSHAPKSGVGACPTRISPLCDERKSPLVVPALSPRTIPRDRFCSNRGLDPGRTTTVRKLA